MSADSPAQPRSFYHVTRARRLRGFVCSDDPRGRRSTYFTPRALKVHGPESSHPRICVAPAVWQCIISTTDTNTLIITTHDQVWTKQMRTAGVVTAKATVALQAWSVETGPVLCEVADVWSLIAQDLAKDDVPPAAAKLRRHLEFVSAELADELGASVPYKGDGAYEMGDLLGAVIGKQGELLGKAAAAAQSWGHTAVFKQVQEMQQARKDCMEKWGGENWIINKAVHFNDWANFTKDEFEPVVIVIKALLEQFRCSNPNCDSWLSVSPKKEPKDLRCSCAAINLNLQKK